MRDTTGGQDQVCANKLVFDGFAQDVAFVWDRGNAEGLSPRIGDSR